MNEYGRTLGLWRFHNKSAVIYADLLVEVFFYEIFKTFKTSDDGLVTNITLSRMGGGSLTNTFVKTKLSLYDAYYILSKCDNNGNSYIVNGNVKNCRNYDNFKITSLNTLFTDCNISFGDKYNVALDRLTYKHCSGVTSISNPFSGCSNNHKIVYYSPVIDGNKIVTNGTFTYLPNLQTYHNISGVIDKNVFKTSSERKTDTAHIKSGDTKDGKKVKVD